MYEGCASKNSGAVLMLAAPDKGNLVSDVFPLAVLVELNRIEWLLIVNNIARNILS